MSKKTNCRDASDTSDQEQSKEQIHAAAGNLNGCGSIRLSDHVLGRLWCMNSPCPCKGNNRNKGHYGNASPPFPAALFCAGKAQLFLYAFSKFCRCTQSVHDLLFCLSMFGCRCKGLFQIAQDFRFGFMGYIQAFFTCFMYGCITLTPPFADSL